jgi:hypothetical protein
MAFIEMKLALGQEIKSVGSGKVLANRQAAGLSVSAFPPAGEMSKPELRSMEIR